MIGRDAEEARAVERVGPRRVDRQAAERFGQALARQGEAHPQALGLADPVALHLLDVLGPAVEPTVVQRREQVLRLVRDLEEPLRQHAPLDRRARPPALAVDHLLVGEHGVVDRVPVHLGLLTLDEAAGEEVEEQLLLVAVVVGAAGRELSGPVDGQAHAPQLTLHHLDVGLGPRAGMLARLHGRVLRRQAEGVPAHRVQDVVALRLARAGDDVAHGVVAHVADMDLPRRVGEHL